MPWTTRRPTPGSANTCSRTTDPPIAVDSRMPIAVTIRISALRNACLPTAFHSLRPLARAVRTKSWPSASSIAERVMRARNPIWKRDSISAGRTSERSQSTGLGKKGVYPLVGSQRRYTPKKRIERIAIQNAGAENRQALAHRGENALVEHQGRTKIALQQMDEPDAELFDKRFVETEIVPHRGDRCGGCLIACDHDSGVAWQESNEEKGEHGHDQDDRNCLQNSDSDQPRHFESARRAAPKAGRVRSLNRLGFFSPRLMPARCPRVAKSQDSRTDRGASSHRPTGDQRRRS